MLLLFFVLDFRSSELQCLHIGGFRSTSSPISGEEVELLQSLTSCAQLETPKLERSGGSMGAGASAQARSAEVRTGLAQLYARMSDEVWLKRMYKG